MNKISIKYLYTQYSEITVEKGICSECEGVEHKYCNVQKDCLKCEGTGKIISKHIVSNNGWLPLSYWINKFTEED